MLSLFRGTAVLIRRLGYAVIAICLFLSSAAIGAAYRDAHPDGDWKRQIADLLRSSAKTTASVLSTLPEAVTALPNDIKQFVQEIRGDGRTKVALQKAKPIEPIEQVEDASFAVDEPEIIKVKAPVKNSPNAVDPLKWLAEKDCDAVRQGMTERYGSARSVEAVGGSILREELRHVLLETCSSDRTSCHFEWCEDEAASRTARAQIALPAEASKDKSEVLAVSAPAAKSAPVAPVARAARFAAVRPAEGAAKTAKLNSERRGNEGAQRPRTLSGSAVAKQTAPIPQDDSLARAEVPSPALGRLSFPEQANDEPDDYRLILRRGEAARNALSRSAGE